MHIEPKTRYICNQVYKRCIIHIVFVFVVFITIIISYHQKYDWHNPFAFIYLANNCCLICNSTPFWCCVFFVAAVHNWMECALCVCVCVCVRVCLCRGGGWVGVDSREQFRLSVETEALVLVEWCDFRKRELLDRYILLCDSQAFSNIRIYSHLH